MRTAGSGQRAVGRGEDRRTVTWMFPLHRPLPAVCCLLLLAGGCAQETEAPISESRALKDPMNYSPDFGKTDKADKAGPAKADPAKSGRGGPSDRTVSGGKDESAWDAFKKDLDHVFNP